MFKNSKPKLLYISDSFIPSKAANSIHVMNIANAFAKLGLEVHLIAFKGDEKSQNDIFSFYGVDANFKIHSFKPVLFPASIPFYMYFCYKTAMQLSPDMIYGRGFFGFFGALFLKSFNGYEVHAPIPVANSLKSYFFKYLQERILKSEKTKFVVTISNALKELLENQGVHKSIYVEHDCASIVDNNQTCEAIKTPEDGLNIGYFGHLYKGRGIEIIIELSNYFANHNFHIVGGNPEDIRYYKDMTKNNNVLFHGFIEPSKINLYRNSCDILLAPYQFKVAVAGDQGFSSSKFMSPLKVFEYMSSKKAIICSDLPVLREVLNDNNSILVKPDDINSWIAAINKLENNNLRSKIAENAYSDFINYYTWEKRAERIAVLLRNETSRV